MVFRDKRGKAETNPKTRLQKGGKKEGEMQKRTFLFRKALLYYINHNKPQIDRKSDSAGKDVPMKLSEARKVLETLQKEIAAEMRYDEQQSLLYGMIWKQRVQALQTVLKVTQDLPDEE